MWVTRMRRHETCDRARNVSGSDRNSPNCARRGEFDVQRFRASTLPMEDAPWGGLRERFPDHGQTKRPPARRHGQLRRHRPRPSDGPRRPAHPRIGLQRVAPTPIEPLLVGVGPRRRPCPARCPAVLGATQRVVVGPSAVGCRARPRASVAARRPIQSDPAPLRHTAVTSVTDPGHVRSRTRNGKNCPSWLAHKPHRPPAPEAEREGDSSSTVPLRRDLRGIHECPSTSVTRRS